MKKYIKKQIKIEAVQWTGDNLIEVAEFLSTNRNQNFVIDNGTKTIELETLEGTMIASDGDYLIKGISGEFYPCKPRIFEESYEEVNE